MINKLCQDHFVYFSWQIHAAAAADDDDVEDDEDKCDAENKFYV